MTFPKGVIAWEINSFKNAHENFTQPLDPSQSFDLHLQDQSWRNLSQLEQYNECTKNLQWVIKQALEKQMAVRAMGSGWSLSKVAVCDDAIINTKRLRHKFTLSEENFHPDYLGKGNKPENHRFLQCGNTIIDINDYLENQSNPAKSLRVSGGSNGQTVVGAFSTNTHGAAVNYGSLPEMILGIHIVSDPDNHFYIERASNQVTSKKFHDKLGATVICDDDLFNAALISFGSFGIIHGVLVEVEDKFLLEQKFGRVTYDDALDDAVANGNYNAIRDLLKYPPEDAEHALYHFELAVNPHDFEFGSQMKGAYLRTMYKIPYKDDYTKIDHVSKGYTYGDDTLGLMQAVLDQVQSSAGFLNRLLIPKLVNKLFNLAYDRPEEAIGTIGETFKNTIFRGSLFSAALGLDRKNVKAVIQHCLETNKETKLAGVLALRFVKGTRATLGFTRWENTCVLEIDGVDAMVNHEFVKALVQRLENAGIDYTLHWGKINRVLNKARLEKMYGLENVEKWKKQRSRIMSKHVQSVFNNEFMELCDLDEYIPFSTPDGVIALTSNGDSDAAIG